MASAPTGTELGGLAGRYVDLLLATRGSDAAQLVLDRMVAGELDAAVVFDGVLGPAATRIGELWHAGAISVADEHYATGVTRSLLGFVTFQNPPIARAVDAPVAVLACPQDELHDLGLAMAGHVLAHEGFDVRVLGAQTPARDLAAAVEEAGASLLGFSLVTPLAIGSAAAAVEEARRRVPGLKVLVGGRCIRDYPRVGEVLDADAACTELGRLPELLERLL